MAKIIRNSHHLEKEYIEEKSHRPLCFAAFVGMLITSVIFGIIYIKSNSNLLAAGSIISLIFGLVALIIGLRQTDEKARILKSGIEGEMSTAYVLSKLPRKYTVVQDINVTYDGGHSEIDNVVIGKTGIFVIETKNTKGTIRGDYNDKDWVQHKSGHGGTPYDKTFYSPVKQVGTHVYRLAHYLRKNGVHTYISGAVYFSNPEAIIKISNRTDDIPIFDCKSQNHMLDYILNNEQNLSDKQIKKAVSLIRRSK